MNDPPWWLTVLRARRRTLPGEAFLYLGDTARVPYGTKSAETVRRYSREAAGELVERGIKTLVVACNTASALALDDLRAAVPVPVIGVVEAGARAAVAATRNRRVGVIGTTSTIASGAYVRALEAHDARLEVHARACPLLVPLAEEGWEATEVAQLVRPRRSTRSSSGAPTTRCSRRRSRGPSGRRPSSSTRRKRPRSRWRARCGRTGGCGGCRRRSRHASS
jgi:glutamate racemase